MEHIKNIKSNQIPMFWLFIGSEIFKNKNSMNNIKDILVHDAEYRQIVIDKFSYLEDINITISNLENICYIFGIKLTDESSEYLYE